MPWTFSKPISQSFHTIKFAVPSITDARLSLCQGSYPFAKFRFAKLAGFAETKRWISRISNSRRKLESRVLLARSSPAVSYEKWNFTYLNKQNRDISTCNVCLENNGATFRHKSAMNAHMQLLYSKV